MIITPNYIYLRVKLFYIHSETIHLLNLHS